MAEEIISIPEVADSGRVLDQDFNEWVLAWQKCFRRQRVFSLEQGKILSNAVDYYTTKAFIAPYKSLTLLFKIAATSGIDLNYAYQFSLDGSDWYFTSPNNSNNQELTIVSVASTNFIQAVDTVPRANYFRLRYRTPTSEALITSFSLSLFADSD